MRDDKDNVHFVPNGPVAAVPAAGEIGIAMSVMLALWHGLRTRGRRLAAG